MSISEDQLEFVRAFFRRAQQGDWSFGAEAMAPDVKYVMSESTFPDPGTLVGPDAMRQAWMGVLRSFEHYRVDNEEIIAAGDRIVALFDGHARLKGSEAEVVTPLASIWEFRGEMVCELVLCSREEGRAAIRDAGD